MPMSSLSLCGCWAPTFQWLSALTCPSFTRHSNCVIVRAASTWRPQPWHTVDDLRLALIWSYMKLGVLLTMGETGGSHGRKQMSKKEVVGHCDFAIKSYVCTIHWCDPFCSGVPRAWVYLFSLPLPASPSFARQDGILFPVPLSFLLCHVWQRSCLPRQGPEGHELLVDGFAALRALCNVQSCCLLRVQNDMAAVLGVCARGEASRQHMDSTWRLHSRWQA